MVCFQALNFCVMYGQMLVGKGCKALEEWDGMDTALALDDAHSLTLVLCGASSAVDQAFEQQDWVVAYRVD
jgi:hypothetical protein